MALITISQLEIKNLSPLDGPGEGRQRKGRDDDDNILKPFEALLKLLSALVDGFMKRLIFVDKANRKLGTSKGFVMLSGGSPTRAHHNHKITSHPREQL